MTASSNGRSQPRLVQRCVAWIGLALCGMASANCRSCEELPSPPRTGEKRPSGLAALAEPNAQWLQQAWEKALQGVTVAEAKAPAEPPRYRPPDCPLQYQLRYLALAEVAAGRPLAGSESLSNYTMSALPDHAGAVSWQLTSASMVPLAEGKPGSVRKGATHAPAKLTTKGDDWLELRGPYPLWSVFGASPPLSLTHPALPNLARVGAQVSWKQRYYPAAAARGLLARKRARNRRNIPQPQPLSRTVDVVVDSWVTLTGGDQADERAWVLVAKWQEEEVGDSPLAFERYGRFAGRYLVSEKGHLIHAIVTARRSHWSSATPGESSEKESLLELELRLTQGCSGHTAVAHTLGAGAATRTLDPH